MAPPMSKGGDGPTSKSTARLPVPGVVEKPPWAWRPLKCEKAPAMESMPFSDIDWKPL